MPRLKLTHEHYRGWEIWIDGKRPPGTARFRGLRYGVGLCANTLEAVKRMIDQKCDDERRRAETMGRDDFNGDGL